MCWLTDEGGILQKKVWIWLCMFLFFSIFWRKVWRVLIMLPGSSSASILQIAPLPPSPKWAPLTNSQSSPFLFAPLLCFFFLPPPSRNPLQPSVRGSLSERDKRDAPRFSFHTSVYLRFGTAPVLCYFNLFWSHFGLKGQHPHRHKLRQTERVKRALSI